MYDLNSSVLKEGSVIKDSKGYNMIREICLLIFLSLGLLLNMLAFVVLRKLAKTNGHYVIVMGLISSNIVCNITLLTLIPFTVRNIHNQVLFAIMFPLSLSTYLVSVSHIACISVERLVAVVKPLHYRTLFSIGRMKVTVLVVWIIALLSHIIIVFANVNPREVKSARYIRFVMFRPYLTVYYSTGLTFIFAVYTVLLICLGCDKKMGNKTVAPLTTTCSASESKNISVVMTIEEELSVSHTDTQGITKLRENGDDKTNVANDVQESGKQNFKKRDNNLPSSGENTIPCSSGVDKNISSFCLGDVAKGNNYNPSKIDEEEKNQRRETTTTFLSDVRSRLQQMTNKPDRYLSPPVNPELEVERLPTPSTSTNVNSEPCIVSQSSRDPKAVMTIGLLILVHLLTGLATLVSYGILGENALSHPTLFGLPIMMTLTNSIFDPFFYVIISKEVRKAMAKIFTGVYYKIKSRRQQ
ncbi:uncharacterized protein LOC121385037 [Gigantopelta aegis]|uniref:uncharacterized protein LOC121385037 n=1 Tax=Gigantopelta aegis TaxID=1735272 RepID=UPI001B888DDA|nr:uncharacterized protein LOC121385037 [Gigantopelta aegis]